MKKKRFLLTAFAISILFHVLLFIFAPELKSEINSNDFMKKITKISIFQETVKPEIPKAEIKSETTQKSAPRKIFKKKEKLKNKEKTSNSEIRKEEPLNIESENEQKNTGNNGFPQDIETSKSPTGTNNGTPGDNDTAASGDIGTKTTPDGNDSAPKTAGELAVIPKAINPKTPPYPESLEEEGVEGNLTLELLISKEGKVLKARIIKSDHELFSESALKTVKNYRFSSGKLKDGSAVDSLIEFVIKFEISL